MEALAHKRVADLLNFFVEHLAILVEYHKDTSFYKSLLKVFIYGKSLSSGCSEEKACHPFFFIALDGTGDKIYAHSALNDFIASMLNIVFNVEIFYVLELERK